MVEGEIDIGGWHNRGRGRGWRGDGGGRVSGRGDGQ